MGAEFGDSTQPMITLKLTTMIGEDTNTRGLPKVAILQAKQEHEQWATTVINQPWQCTFIPMNVLT